MQGGGGGKRKENGNGEAPCSRGEQQIKSHFIMLEIGSIEGVARFHMPPATVLGLHRGSVQAMLKSHSHKGFGKRNAFLGTRQIFCFSQIYGASALAV